MLGVRGGGEMRGEVEWEMRGQRWEWVVCI